MSLDNLASKIAKKDKTAFREVYEKMNKIVYSVCLGIVKNRGLAEELTQDTFLAVWTKSFEFRGKGYKTWILTIARNKSINSLKKNVREFSADFTENESLGGSYTIDTAADTKMILSAALLCLKSDERQIVLLKNSGMKMKEIAEYMDIPRGTVSWKYSEAIKTLKKYLEEVAE